MGSHHFREEASAAEVAAVLSSRERKRLMHSNKKLGNLLGDGFQSSLAPLLDRTNFDQCLSHNNTHRLRACSPISDSASEALSILQIRRTSSCAQLPTPTDLSDTSDSRPPSGMFTRKPVQQQTATPPISSSLPNSSPLIFASEGRDAKRDSSEVAPLNLRPRIRRKSLSLSGVEMSLSERNALQLQLTDTPGSAPPVSLTRSHTLSRIENRESRYRPLPRPPSHDHSRNSSISSMNSHNQHRPLPTPPASSSRPSPPKLYVSNPSTRPNSPTPIHVLSPILSDTESQHADEQDSALTPLTAFARPLKKKRTASISSLSTLALIPPPPTPAESRKRQMDKMAKLMRILGESPPPELVFGPKEGGAPVDASVGRVGGRHSRKSSSDTQRKVEPVFAEKARSRSASLRRVEKEKERFTIDDEDSGSECMHSEAHAHVYMSSDIRAFPMPVGPQASRLRARPRPKKDDSEVPMRRVVSLNVDAHTPYITFGAQMSKKHSRPKTSSTKPVTVSLSPRKPGKHGSSHWVKEVGDERWEVESYGNVVRTLREL